MSKETGKWHIYQSQVTGTYFICDPAGNSVATVHECDGNVPQWATDMLASYNAALAIKADAPFALPVFLLEGVSHDGLMISFRIQGNEIVDGVKQPIMVLGPVFVRKGIDEIGITREWMQFVVAAINAAPAFQSIVAERDALKAECERLRLVIETAAALDALS